MVVTNPPKSGRELAAYLADHRLIMVSGFSPSKGGRAQFVANIESFDDGSITVTPFSGGRKVTIPMPFKWTGEKTKTAAENHHIKDRLKFHDDGFTTGFIRIHYLDERNPFI